LKHPLLTQFHSGAEQIGLYQLKANIRVHPGEAVDPAKIGADVNGFATRLFGSVAYTLEPAGENRYDLVFNTRIADEYV
jgi:hypothetical protein